jgi:hypothetical protein
MKRIAVLGLLLSGGSLQLSASSTAATFLCPPGVSPPSIDCTVVSQPIVEAGEAKEVTPVSALLSGAVNTYGAASTYYFEYGLSAAYGTRTPTGLLAAAPGEPASATSSTVQAQITGLTPASAYHFRLVASNASGTTASADMTFTTPNESGVTTSKKRLRASGERLIALPINCAKQPRCAGRILLVPRSPRRSAGHADYGQARYSIAYGANARLRIVLTRAAREILARRGRLTIEALAEFADPHRVAIATVTILAPKRRVAHAKAHHGHTH